MAAWHWNAKGTWSDPKDQSGYFTGAAELGDPIRYILACALPHRGFSTCVEVRTRLSQDKVSNLDDYLTREFAPHLSLKRVTPPDSIGAATNPPPFSIREE
jgi:hypothetical protein